jgi:polysaccharide biosynthesis/export protein
MAFPAQDAPSVRRAAVAPELLDTCRMQPPRRLSLASSVPCAVALLWAVAATGAERPEIAPLERPSSFRIGPEDVLQISVWKNDALTRTVPVRPDGMISLPLLNDVRAAGLTPMELRDALTRRLAPFVPLPEVSVIVAEVRSCTVSVIGEVAKPGRYDLKGAVTVIDALALAGGFKEFASRSHIVVLRSEGGNTSRLAFDYDQVKSGGHAQANFPLRPGDVVIVP